MRGISRWTWKFVRFLKLQLCPHRWTNKYHPVFRSNRAQNQWYSRISLLVPILWTSLSYYHLYHYSPLRARMKWGLPWVRRGPKSGLRSIDICNCFSFSGLLSRWDTQLKWLQGWSVHLRRERRKCREPGKLWTYRMVAVRWAWRHKWPRLSQWIHR